MVDAEINVFVDDRVADGVKISGDKAEVEQIVWWAEPHDLKQ